MEALTVCNGDTYILYPSFKTVGILFFVNPDNGVLLGKCIECLYDGKGNEYGLYSQDITYVFLLNEETSTYSHDFLFANHKALFLVEDTSEKVIHIKTEFNNEQKIPQHRIFSDGNIIRKLLCDCLPILNIEKYIDIITMIVCFGRVNRLCYEASKEIKANIISSLDAPYGIETFRLTPEVGKLYTFMFAEKVMYQYKQKKAYHRYFGMENTMRYVGMLISHKQTGHRYNPEHTYTFQKGDEIINIRLELGSCKCFNHVEECNSDEDPCEIICKRDNKKRLEELFEKEHLKHHYKERIYKCLNIGKNADKQTVDNAENEAKECIKKLWDLNQPDPKIENY